MPYFDHNATAPLLPVAREAWLRASDEAWANPSSPYARSARVHRQLGEMRARVAGVLGVAAEEIVFTSGATEANNAVIRWVGRSLPAGARVVISPTEHPSVLEPAREVAGDRLIRIEVARDGCIDPTVLEVDRGGLLAVMAANNETGVLAPVAACDAHCRERGAWYLCDASQWIGRLQARSLAPNGFVVACAHKFGGPKGAGFLRVPPSALAAGFRAQLGGGQEYGRRAGTEDLPAIAAMVAALEHAEGFAGSVCEREAWRVRFIDTVTREIAGSRVNSGDAFCLWNTVSLRPPAYENTRWVVRLDRLGFEVSTGSACATGSAAPSHVLAAMGLTIDEARRTIRISSGWETTERDWRDLAAAIVQVWRQLETEDAGGSIIRV